MSNRGKGKLDAIDGRLEQGGMAQKAKDPNQKETDGSARRKAALKANMARRKAQARARSATNNTVPKAVQEKES